MCTRPRPRRPPPTPATIRPGRRRARPPPSTPPRRSAPSPAPPSPPPPLNSPPPCATLTAPGAPSPLSVCPAALPLVQTAVQTGASDALTTITTSDQGTLLDTVAGIAGTQLLDGLITIATLRTERRAMGDG